MKTKDLEKIRKSTADELNKKVSELKIERDRALADMSAGKESNLKKAKLLKKEIAQYLTVITENNNK